MITVCVAADERDIIGVLVMLASLSDGIWWYSAYDDELGRWVWQFDFKSRDEAQAFMRRLPMNCIGALIRSQG